MVEARAVVRSNAEIDQQTGTGSTTTVSGKVRRPEKLASVRSRRAREMIHNWRCTWCAQTLTQEEASRSG
jgi:hypothetical protein